MYSAFRTPYAKVTGLIYFCYFLTAVFGAFLGKQNLVVYSYILNIISIACYLAVTVLFYYLFKPVHKFISLLAAFLSFTGCVLTTLASFHITDVINPLVFFGPYCILLGYLVIRSTFIPPIIGMLLVSAGIGWLILLASPGYNISLFIKILGFLAEVSLMFWLLFKGVDIPQWKKQAEKISGGNSAFSN